MVKDTVTIVNQTSNERMYYGCGSIFREWLKHSIHLLQNERLDVSDEYWVRYEEYGKKKSRVWSR